MSLNEELLCYNCFKKWPAQMESCPWCGYNAAARKRKYPQALPDGSILAGQYLVGNVIGQGGYGITYAALDVKKEKKVAIKEFFPESLVRRSSNGHSVRGRMADAEGDLEYGKSQFLLEARILAGMSGHPHIVQVKRYFEENSTAYFAMEYIDGISLQGYIRNHGGSISWPEVTSLMAPVMGALHTAHQNGIIHRDVSPDNIIITSSGTVKLLDFGAARFSLGDRSKSFDVMLKAGYAPVEQYSRHSRQGPFTDVYAVAASMYAAITGYLPPESIERDERDTIKTPSQMGIALPAGKEKVLMKGLAVYAKDRYQTMLEFGKAVLPRAEWKYFSAAPKPQVTEKMGGEIKKEKRSLWDLLKKR